METGSEEMNCFKRVRVVLLIRSSRSRDLSSRARRSLNCPALIPESSLVISCDAMPSVSRLGKTQGHRDFLIWNSLRIALVGDSVLA